MKRILSIILCAVFLLSGCDKPEESVTIPTELQDVATTAAPSTTPSVTVSEQTEMGTELFAVSVPATTETVEHENGKELFSFTSQHMQLILPNASAADKVVLDFLNRVDTARIDAQKILNAAHNEFENNGTWYPYFYQILYSPTRIDHGVLSLFGTQNSYAGGIHGNKSGIAANYDLLTGDVLTLGSIMHPEATTEDFIRLINLHLKDHIEEYGIYDDYEVGVQNRLGGDENLYEDFFFTPTGLNFFFSPYEIAPYSSGIITVEIPYNELPGLIYDGYYPAEREQISGKMIADSFDLANTGKFNNMAEVILSAGAPAYAIYPEGKVENIRIYISGDNAKMPEYTVFAAFEMAGNDAIIMNLDETMIERVTIGYETSNHSDMIQLK